MKQVFFNEDGTLNVSQSAKLHQRPVEFCSDFIV